MFCSHFKIVCDYNGFNEGKQFSLWLSLSLCFCGVLCIVQRIRHTLFILRWNLLCSTTLDKAPSFEWVPSVWAFLGGNVATENLHIWCRWSICQYWATMTFHTHHKMDWQHNSSWSGLRLHSTSSWSFLLFSLQSEFDSTCLTFCINWNTAFKDRIFIKMQFIQDYKTKIRQALRQNWNTTF